MPKCQRGMNPSRLDRFQLLRYRRVDSRERRSVLDPCGRSEECQHHGCRCPWRTRCRYQSCRQGSQGSRRSSQHYGSPHGTWDSRSHPIFHSLVRTGGPRLHLCHRHQVCSSRLHRHGNQSREGSSTSRLDQRLRSCPCSDRSTGRHPSPCHLCSQKGAHQRCVRKPSSSMSARHRCDGSRGGNGEVARRSSTLPCA